ncbi:MAG TPA: shikimate dehydrogenase [Candidatus Limnocylindria bacterium]|nr:shikimate dehydrogenase [Candidatus Limnocylindria bacterium]
MTTVRVVLLGDPVAHSLSPAMHNAAFRALELDATYEARRVTSAELGLAVQELRREPYLGANITIPHKEAVLGLVDDWDEEVQRIGAANTLVRRGERVLGFNTDRTGFRAAVDESGCTPTGETVLMLGAGGAARACVLELADTNDVLVASRTYERARALVESIRAPGGRASAIQWDDAQRLRSVDALVNATPLGLKGEDAIAGFHFDALPPLVIDLVPVASDTPLVRRARQARVRFMGGLPMLLHQAAASFALWTGRPAPLEVMRSALAATV